MPRPNLPLSSRSLPLAATQFAALVAVGAIGATALQAVTTVGPRAIRPAAGALGQPQADRLNSDRYDVGQGAAALAAPHGAAAVAAAAVAPRALPVVRHVTAKKKAPAPRWIPTGTGMWIYQWGKTNHGHAASVVAQAHRVGLTTLFVRTGSSHDGFTGAKVLHALLPATRKTQLHVVAWDFPELKHPAADARRLARAASYGRHGATHVAAVAPDIETPSEGTRLSVARVSTYLKTLRRLLPHDVAILATVPWPSHERRGHFPYATVARHSDALLPMAYWYNNPPSLVTRRSVGYLRQFHKPVQPVGQGYDGKIDVPSLPHNNLRKQVPVFLSTARSLHVGAVSMWSWQSAPGATWSALARARRWFPAHR